jgi:hypothetical protein
MVVQNMKKLVLITGMLVTAILVLVGQTAEEETIRLKQSTALEQLQQEAPLIDQVPPAPDQKRGSLNMSVGTSYTYMSGYGSLMGIYAAPTYTLSLNKRWSLHGGLLATGYTGLNPYSVAGEYQNTPTMSSLAVFAAASYRMSDRLVLHTAGVKHLLSAPASPLIPYPADNLSLGATYKLGDNITIGAAVQMNRGNGYYTGSPFQPSYLTSPFGW